MGKVQKRSQHGGGGTGSGGSKPYSRSSSSTTGPSSSATAKQAVNRVFKMNTDLGQHILKNPGVAQAIVDKAGLKQSDVFPPPPPPSLSLTSHRTDTQGKFRLCWK